MARASGYAPSTIHRIWRAFGLHCRIAQRPSSCHRTQCSWRRCAIIVGLYLSPPERALVLCVDEKSQIQALDRTQPLLPMRPGQVERRTHDYIRHRDRPRSSRPWTSPPARFIGQCFPRHRSREFLKFLRTLETRVRRRPRRPSGDGQSTRPTRPLPSSVGWPAIRDWHVHFTPTGASWLQPGRALLRPAVPRNRSGAGSIGRRRNSNRPFGTTSTPSTPTRDPSDGPNPPTTSSPQSNASACVPSIPQNWSEGNHQNFRIGTLGRVRFLGTANDADARPSIRGFCRYSG